MPLHDLTNKAFSRLTVIKRAESAIGRSGKKRTRWYCKCICGTELAVRADALKSGKTKSCGCLHRDYSQSGDARRTHGYTPTGNHASEYNIWSGMKGRCLNANNQAYKNYGGRGITVCEQWKLSFQSFIDDMGERPSPAHTIDRIDNNGPYSPDNCRWATRKQQSTNKRSNILITANGKTKLISQWAAELGINSQTLERRYHAGWDHDRIINQPVLSAR